MKRIRPTLWRGYQDLPNGQVAMLSLRLDSRKQGREYWFVEATIGQNRRQCKHTGSYKEMTGRCGLSGLVAIFKMIKEAERLLIKPNKRVIFEIEWTEEKRYRAYRRLLKHGYTEDDYCFYKQIPPLQSNVL